MLREQRSERPRGDGPAAGVRRAASGGQADARPAGGVPAVHRGGDRGEADGRAGGAPGAAQLLRLGERVRAPRRHTRGLPRRLLLPLLLQAAVLNELCLIDPRFR
jgi:hypothetical protein